MARYADYLAVARLEQLLDDVSVEHASGAVERVPVEVVAKHLVAVAVSTSFQPRRRQVTITFDLPTDDDPPQDDPAT